MRNVPEGETEFEGSCSAGVSVISSVFISPQSSSLFLDLGLVRFSLFSLFIPSVTLIENVPQMFPPVSPLVVVWGSGVVNISNLLPLLSWTTHLLH